MFFWCTTAKVLNFFKNRRNVAGMNHYLRKHLIKIWCALYYRRHHTFDVKTWFQQNLYVIDVIVTSFVFCIITYSPQFFLWHWRRIACTKSFSWFQCTQTVLKINTIIYRNTSYLLMNFITWNESWNVQIVYIMVSYIQSEEWKYWF
jgi:hypothetical protein